MFYNNCFLTIRPTLLNFTALFGQSNISFGTPQGIGTQPSFSLGSTPATTATGFGFTSATPANTTLGKYHNKYYGLFDKINELV